MIDDKQQHHCTLNIKVQGLDYNRQLKQNSTLIEIMKFFLGQLKKILRARNKENESQDLQWDA